MRRASPAGTGVCLRLPKTNNSICNLSCLSNNFMFWLSSPCLVRFVRGDVDSVFKSLWIYCKRQREEQNNIGRHANIMSMFCFCLTYRCVVLWDWIPTQNITENSISKSSPDPPLQQVTICQISPNETKPGHSHVYKKQNTDRVCPARDVNVMIFWLAVPSRRLGLGNTY